LLLAKYSKTRGKFVIWCKENGTEQEGFCKMPQGVSQESNSFIQEVVESTQLAVLTKILLAALWNISAKLTHIHIKTCFVPTFSCRNQTSNLNASRDQQKNFNEPTSSKTSERVTDHRKMTCHDLHAKYVTSRHTPWQIHVKLFLTCKKLNFTTQYDMMKVDCFLVMYSSFC